MPDGVQKQVAEIRKKCARHEEGQRRRKSKIVERITISLCFSQDWLQHGHKRLQMLLILAPTAYAGRVDGMPHLIHHSQKQ